MHPFDVTDPVNLVDADEYLAVELRNQLRGLAEEVAEPVDQLRVAEGHFVPPQGALAPVPDTSSHHRREPQRELSFLGVALQGADPVPLFPGPGSQIGRSDDAVRPGRSIECCRTHHAEHPPQCGLPRAVIQYCQCGGVILDSITQLAEQVDQELRRLVAGRSIHLDGEVVTRPWYPFDVP